MDTKIIKINDIKQDIDQLMQAAKILKNGGLVAFPTETVYGIGANALSEEAVKKIYIAKGRPSDNPLIAHLYSQSEVKKYAVDIDDRAYRVMDKFWPGPLTIILKKSPIISDIITGGLETVALRVPSNPIARKLIELADLPIAAPSANISGRPSPTDVEHVIEDLDGRVDMIIDGGATDIGLESTVLDLSGQIPTILRPGKVNRMMLLEVLDEVVFDQSLMIDNQDITPRSPGMKYKHYAPKGKLKVVRGSEVKSIALINEWTAKKEALGYKVGIISTKENQQAYGCQHVKVIGSKDNHDEIAANLFAILRQMDDEKVDYIYTRAFSEEEIGHATMNRLMKAAGNESVSVD